MGSEAMMRRRPGTNQAGNRHAPARGALCAWCAVLVAALACPRDLRAGTPPQQAVEQAVDRGLAFLQQRQKPDGSFDAAASQNAATGLAILAFLAAGHTPDVGRYGVCVRAAVDHLLRLDPAGGYYGQDGGGMYSHAIVTLALAEAYGMESEARQRDRTRAAIEKALRVIYAAQDVKKDRDAGGGWCQEPESDRSELSVSAWCVLALRACQNAGLVVPRSRVERAAAYVARCFRPEQGGFAPTPDGEATPAMTGAAALSLCLLDAGDRDELAVAMEFLWRRGFGRGGPARLPGIFFIVQAANQVGGRHWTLAWRRASELLLSSQSREDGSWPGDAGETDRAGAELHATAIACLTLSIPTRILPVYQR